ncbi:MAG: hypothetical protein PX638_07610, partial [Microcystis sp. M53599_WE4]|nr:hypothetical protein [Microcystis sp. M53599_WE4]
MNVSHHFSCQDSGDRIQETGFRRQDSGDRRQETGDYFLFILPTTPLPHYPTTLHPTPYTPHPTPYTPLPHLPIPFKQDLVFLLKGSFLLT